MIEQLIAEGFDNYINRIIDESISMFLLFLTGIAEIGQTVLDLPIVVNGILLTQGICLAILGAKVGYEALMTYILRMSGDPDADPQTLLFGTIQSTAVIMCIPWFVRFAYQFGISMAADVSQLPGIDFNSNNSGSILQEIVNKVQTITQMPLFLAWALLVAVILIVIILAQTFIRGGELAVAAVVGAFMALGFTNRSSSFASWLMDLIGICFAPALQIFIVKMAFSSLHAITFSNPWYSLCLFLALLYLSVKTPAIAKKYAHSTGIGRLAGGASQQAISSVMLRRALTKGA